LDALFLLPVAFVCQVPIFIYFLAIINQFPRPDQSSNNATFPIGLIVGLYGVFFICIFLEIAVALVWEAVATRT
jgi:hypothetical protein